jgi:8-oxo-dGTP pyrophosphatase MutT (NUDIX family)
MPSLKLIRSRVAAHTPRLARATDGHFEAAVAIVLHQPTDAPPELLFIERAIREGDPWSGQMAFPGGRREGVDPHLERTAARETHEEVGFELGPPIGRLDDFEGSRASQQLRLLVAPFVYELPSRPAITISPEVRSAVWIPIPHLLDPGSARSYRFEREGFGGTFPSLEFRGYTVWGLTYRILGDFFALLGEELPRPADLDTGAEARLDQGR